MKRPIKSMLPKNVLLPLVTVALLAAPISLAQAQGTSPGPGYRWVPAINSWVGPPVKHRKVKDLGEIAPRPDGTRKWQVYQAGRPAAESPAEAKGRERREWRDRVRRYGPGGALRLRW